MPVPGPIMIIGTESSSGGVKPDCPLRTKAVTVPPLGLDPR